MPICLYQKASYILADIESSFLPMFRSMLAKGNIQDISLKKLTHVNADITACKDYKNKVKTHLHN